MYVSYKLCKYYLIPYGNSASVNFVEESCNPVDTEGGLSLSMYISVIFMTRNA